MSFKKKVYLILLIISFLFLIRCGSHTITSPDFEEITFRGKDDSFEIVTWNLEHFPLNDDQTTSKLKSIITELDLDIIAVQEIANTSIFLELADQLVSYEAIILESYNEDNAQYYNPPVGYLVKNNVEILDSYHIYEGDYWAFPRTPIVLQLEWNNEEIFIINNHLKANQEGTSDEDRRREACIKLETYIENYLDDKNVIVVGDFNDSIEEDEETNVFLNFINNEEFLFADMIIAESSSDNFSYPYGYTSHLDHILISNELFDEYNSDNRKIETLMIEDWFFTNSSSYFSTISDHRPVGLQINF